MEKKVKHNGIAGETEHLPGSIRIEAMRLLRRLAPAKSPEAFFGGTVSEKTALSRKSGALAMKSGGAPLFFAVVQSDFVGGFHNPHPQRHEQLKKRPAKIKEFQGQGKLKLINGDVRNMRSFSTIPFRSA